MTRLEPFLASGDNNTGEAAASSELWTLQEETQGVAPGYQFVPLTRRPASFSVMSSGSAAPQPPTAAIAPRGRAGSCDIVPSPTAGGDEETSSAGVAGAGDGASGAGSLVNEEGFPLLLRRRTFTEPSLLSKRRCLPAAAGDDDGVGRGGQWRVPVSVSEDNMLSLLSKRSAQALAGRHRPPPRPATTMTTTTTPDLTTVSISDNSGSFGSSSYAGSEGVGGAAETVPMQQQEEQPSPASQRARRNEFVIRYVA